MLQSFCNNRGLVLFTLNRLYYFPDCRLDSSKRNLWSWSMSLWLQSVLHLLLFWVGDTMIYWVKASQPAQASEANQELNPLTSWSVSPLGGVASSTLLKPEGLCMHLLNGCVLLLCCSCKYHCSCWKAYVSVKGWKSFFHLSRHVKRKVGS